MPIARLPHVLAAQFISSFLGFRQGSVSSTIEDYTLFLVTAIFCIAVKQLGRFLEMQAMSDVVRY